MVCTHPDGLMVGATPNGLRLPIYAGKWKPMTQNNYGMLWQGTAAQLAIAHFEAKYSHKVTFVASKIMPADCPVELWVCDPTIQKGNLFIGATDFRPRGEK